MINSTYIHYFLLLDKIDLNIYFDYAVFWIINESSQYTPSMFNTIYISEGQNINQRKGTLLVVC